MKLRLLDLEHFEATLIPPVRHLAETERPAILLRDYLLACDETYQLQQSGRDFIALRLFLSGDNMHVHAVFWYGHPDRVLVLVLNRTTDSIVGHHFLSLPDQPDTQECAVPNPKSPPHLVRPEAKELPKS